MLRVTTSIGMKLHMMNKEPEIRSRQWEDNGKNRTSGFQTEIQFRGNVRNLRIKVQEKDGSCMGTMAYSLQPHRLTTSTTAVQLHIGEQL